MFLNPGRKHRLGMSTYLSSVFGVGPSGFNNHCSISGVRSTSESIVHPKGEISSSSFSDADAESPAVCFGGVDFDLVALAVAAIE
jgi:hypothetical protein